MRRGGGKAMFAQKRRKIWPISPTPVHSQSLLKHVHTTDPLRESRKIKYGTAGKDAQDQLDLPERLEGRRSKENMEKSATDEFDNLVSFIHGKRFDGSLRGSFFQRFYDMMQRQDDVIMWLCMVSMSVLNPGDMQSRLLYQHLQALTNAVASGEMNPRQAFKFYENAVRSPAYRVAAQRQTLHGNSTRLVGICAAAESLREMNVCRRSMQPYFELYQRITERSEVFTPWGFPPLYQFEERMQVLERLRPFTRAGMQNMSLSRKKKRGLHGKYLKYFTRRIVWIPPTWAQSRTWMGPRFSHFRGIVPD
eukprot:PhM_4_TR1944/c0_g1_i1/m.91900